MLDLYTNIACSVGLLALITASYRAFVENKSERELIIDNYIYFSSLFNTIGWLSVAFLNSYFLEYRCLWNNNSNLIYSTIFPFLVLAFLWKPLKRKYLFLLTIIIIASTILLNIDSVILIDQNNTLFAVLFFIACISLGIYLLKTREVLDFTTVFIYIMSIDCLMQGFYQVLSCDFDTVDCGGWELFRYYYGVVLTFMWGVYTYKYGIRRLFK